MKQGILALCGCVMTASAAFASVVIPNADIVYIEGQHQVAVVSGTHVYSHWDDESESWKALFTRNDGSSSIEVDGPPGVYQMKVWSIPANPSSPVRIMTDSTLEIGGGYGGPVDATHLLGLLSQWGPCPQCMFDLNGDGSVDVMDLLALLGMWGTPWPGGAGAGDSSSGQMSEGLPQEEGESSASSLRR